jgi:hypothetical protein
MMRQPLRLQTIMIRKKKDANIALAPSRMDFLIESGRASRCSWVNAIGALTIAACVEVSDVFVDLIIAHTEKLYHGIYEREECPSSERKCLVPNVALEIGRFPTGKPSQGEDRSAYCILGSTFDDSFGRHVVRCASASQEIVRMESLRRTLRLLRRRSRKIYICASHPGS